VQEISRYNKLMSTVRKSLMDLDKGINGLVLISEDLELIMKSLYENKVPQQWKFAHYSLKPLNAWVLDLNKRIEQLRNWVQKGQPEVFWISGFSFPTGFTTALQQQASRKFSVPLDQFSWEFTFEKMDTSISSPAKEGAYIEGLFLEGARCDSGRNCIAEAEPIAVL
jgi:dynein heavy chain